MKYHWTKPGFELIFSLTLIAIMAIPPLVFAQETKTMEIRINNGDTTINGKNLKDLSAADKKQALKDIDNLGPLKSRMSGHGNGTLHDIVIERREMSDTGLRRERGMRFGNRDGAMARRDTAGRVLNFRMHRPNGKDSVFSFNYRMKDDRMMNDDREMRFDDRERGPEFRMRGSGRSFMHRRNVQNFDYTNTGSDGITTHLSFRVSDASPEKGKMKESIDAEKAELEIKDLNLVPEFSAGKTVMMFSLAAHTPAEVKLTDNEGKTVWTDKALNGNFNKSFGLGLNGIYYLQVKQAGKTAVKRIVKEE